MSYSTKVYREQGGDKLVAASGSTVALEAGATVTAAGSNVVFGETGLTVSEVAFVTGVTAGTVTASKAVVVDGSKNVGTLGTVTAATFTGNLTGNVTGNVSGTTVTATGTIKGGAIAFETGTNDVTFTATGANVIVTNLPTSNPAVAGALWNDSGTLKISTGA